MKKDIEWLKGRFWGRKLFHPKNDKEIGYNMAIDEFSEYVDQLEMETVEITEEQVMNWLDNNDFYDHATAETVLANAVDKGELGYYGTKYSVVEKPTIPKFVADWIEFKKKSRIPYENVLQAIDELVNSSTSKAHDWVLKTSENKDTFARAWLDGYTVEEEEKEQKYVVKTNLGTYLIIDTSKREWDYTSIPPQDDDIQYAYKFDDRSMAEGIAKLVEGKVEVWEE